VPVGRDDVGAVMPEREPDERLHRKPERPGEMLDREPGAGAELGEPRCRVAGPDVLVRVEVLLHDRGIGEIALRREGNLDVQRASRLDERAHRCDDACVVVDVLQALDREDEASAGE